MVRPRLRPVRGLRCRRNRLRVTGTGLGRGPGRPRPAVKMVRQRTLAVDYGVGGWLVYTVGSPWTIQTVGLLVGTNDRSPPGSRVVGTVSPPGRCMMKLTGCW